MRQMKLRASVQTFRRRSFGSLKTTTVRNLINRETRRKLEQEKRK